MEVFLAVLVFLVLIGISNIINRFVPFVPIPLIQIALGVAVAVIPSGIHLPLEPELFFVLFIAPLLYNDGKHTPRDELWRLRAPILLLAVGLVFITVFVVGYAVHWMIPSIPLPAAFGLAAILSPTDAVAVSALAGRIHLPKSLMRLLEGEALMNDASGLVAFKFAIAATVTGVFSLPHATVSFFVISIGGLVIGAVLAFLITGLRMLLRRAGMEDETMHMLLQLLTPFLLYLIAEELGMSGILAAVAGGIVHAIENDRPEASMPKLKVVSANTWSVILFILNGLVFVILGQQIPDVSRKILNDPAFNNYQAVGYAVVIFVMLIVLRFVWTFLFTRWPYVFGRKQDREAPSFKVLVMTSISGVRGAVTLAGAFSIPLVLDNGDAFPERNLIIFLAAVVILLSLLTASILLPLLARRKETADAGERESMEREYQLRVMKAAVLAIHRERNDDNAAAVAAAIGDYRKRMSQIKRKDGARRNLIRSTRETETHLLALGAERDFVRKLLAEEEISPGHAKQFFKMLDQTELILANRFHAFEMMFKMLLRRLTGQLFTARASAPRLSEADMEALRLTKIRSCEAAIQAVKQQCSTANEEEAAAVLAYYHNVLDRLSRLSPALRHKDERFEERKKELHWIAVQAERDEVQTLYEQGEITRQTAAELRRLISEREAAMFEQDEIG